MDAEDKKPNSINRPSAKQNSATSLGLPMPIGATIAWLLVLVIIPWLNLPGPLGGLSGPSLLALCAVLTVVLWLSWHAQRVGWMHLARWLGFVMLVGVGCLFYLVQRSLPAWVSLVPDRLIIVEFLLLVSGVALYFVFLSKNPFFELPWWGLLLVNIMFLGLIVAAFSLIIAAWWDWPAVPSWLVPLPPTQPEFVELISERSLVRLFGFVALAWVVVLAGITWWIAPKGLIHLAAPLWVLVVGILSRLGSPGWLGWLVFFVVMAVVWRILAWREKR